MTTAERPAGELPAQFDPAASEKETYARWEAAGVFHATAADAAARPHFTIVIPPPNVTAVLHMGHGLNDTVQDVLVRWRRMAGDTVLWIPGTDHAGIATQNIIEKQLAKEGKTRFDVGREAFVARTRQFVAETGGVILRQLRAIGCSCDWERTAYTFDGPRSRATRKAFVRLYDEGLIYRGHRVIHWCPRCLTSLSDEEAEFRDTSGQLWHVRYAVAGDPSRSITVATTRPETMLGDVAVAVHPDDERYAGLVGHRVILPVSNLEIPVIADPYVDRAFGTGVVKITPAHDPNDFEVGRRHELPMPVVIDEHGTVREVSEAGGRVPASLQGLDRFAARKAIVKLLDAAGHLARAEPHAHSVRHCYRCDTVVEPRLSDQWYLRMKPLAEPCIAAVRDGTVRILPERWEAVYFHWMENIRDWNISRQLWWGHRIPLFYCDNPACRASRLPPVASMDDLATCARCDRPLRQDEDVLDTWASSWLWPLSTLGWPDETDDLAAFYPTDMLVTAPEILFLWVARMMMSGYKFRGRAPFHTVYLHGTVRDAKGRKMSKSLGNGIDPLEVVEQFGADALRWTVIAGMGLGADVLLDHADLGKAFAPGRNFATKLWNIGRFLLASVGEEAVLRVDDIPSRQLKRSDKWILDCLNVAIGQCNAALGHARPQGPAWPMEQRFEGLRLDAYAESARRFVWNELADWYVEAVKPRILAGGVDGQVARSVLAHAFDQALRLLHPIMPFITEELSQRLPGRPAGEFVATAGWPRLVSITPGAADFELVMSSVDAIRSLRNAAGIAPGVRVKAFLIPTLRAEGFPDQLDPSVTTTLTDEAALIGALARADVSVVPSLAVRGLREFCGTHEVDLPVSNLPAELRERECRKARAESEALAKQLASLTARLGNESFTSRAKPEVVAAERQKEREWTEKLAQLRAKVGTLCG
ncbi:MAG: valine--tRNA ligase [Gemmatimonadetes bacterium]|nr:valine--tRNA ligase [Gemmatimonadota bacterium]